MTLRQGSARSLAPLFRGERVGVSGEALRQWEQSRLGNVAVPTRESAIVADAVPDPSPEAFAALRLRPLPAKRAGRGKFTAAPRGARSGARRSRRACPPAIPDRRPRSR